MYDNNYVMKKDRMVKVRIFLFPYLSDDKIHELRASIKLNISIYEPSAFYAKYIYFHKILKQCKMLPHTYKAND